MVNAFFENLLGRALRPLDSERTSGPPTSSNGASSFHLFWDAPSEPLAEVSVVCEVTEPPTVAKLYFWALQVNFTNGGRKVGGAHFGLQHHPSYPGDGAVNWGGYHDGGGELDGSVSQLPSALNNINTRTYPWQPARAYRHRVYRSPDRGWRGSITDLATGEEVVVRDLWVDADALTSPMVWSEVFANCDHPPAAVRWTELESVTTSGQRHQATSVRLNYQTFNNGGCANTNASVEGGGFVQRTGVARSNPTGTTLHQPAP